MSMTSFSSFYDLFFKKTGYIPVFILGSENTAVFEGKRHNVYDNICFYRFLVDFKNNKMTVLLLGEDENLKIGHFKTIDPYPCNVSFEEGIEYYIKQDSLFVKYD